MRQQRVLAGGISFCMSGDARKRASGFIRSAKSGAELEPYVEKVLELLLGEKEMCLVNVNLPERPKGIRWTRQAVKQYDGKVVPGKDPMKRAIYWFTIKPLEGEEEGTDRWAFGKNFVSITPLRLDLTDEKDLARVLALPITPARTARRKPPAKSTKRNSSR